MMNLHKSILHPLRNLLRLLPKLPITPDATIDYEAADPELLLALEGSAEATLIRSLLGLHAMGLLMARAALDVEIAAYREISAAAGNLTADVADLALMANETLTRIRPYTADYVPPEPPNNLDMAR